MIGPTGTSAVLLSTAAAPRFVLRRTVPAWPPFSTSSSRRSVGPDSIDSVWKLPNCLPRELRHARPRPVTAGAYGHGMETNGGELAEWATRAIEILEGFGPVFGRVTGGGSSVPGFVASADELQSMARDALRWSDAHPCPRPAADRHFRAMIDTINHMATVIFRANAERTPGGPVKRRITELAKTFARHGEKLEEICQR